MKRRTMKTFSSLLVALAASLAIAGAASALDEDGSNSYVKLNGALGDGINDDTIAFQQAFAQVKAGGLIVLPEGHYTLSSTIVITKPVTIVGTGFATQIYNKNNQTLFQFVNVNNSAIRDVYLGSSSTAAGVSLIEFNNSHHNQINNVTMLGGYYGLHLAGSLLNTIIDLRSGTNFQGFFAATSTNNTWVMAEPLNGISANANTFIAPALEGGTNGIVIKDNNGQGSLHITGGTIEGVSGTGLTFQGTFLPSSITGVDFEANGQDISIQGSSNIRLTAINSAPGPATTNPSISLSGDTRNVQITDSIVASLGVASTAKRIMLQNITFGTPGGIYCANAILNVPVTVSNTIAIGSNGVLDPITNITAINVGNYCGGQ
jgi:hypothetical protein